MRGQTRVKMYPNYSRAHDAQPASLGWLGDCLFGSHGAAVDPVWKLCSLLPEKLQMEGDYSWP